MTKLPSRVPLHIRRKDGKPVVYLCGPIAFCDDDECKSWRDTFKELHGEEFNALDPLRRDYRGVEHINVEQLVQDDLTDIANSDVILVAYTRPSTGTAMEMVYAHLMGIPIIVVAKDPSILSPWTVRHASAVTQHWGTAVNLIRTHAANQLLQEDLHGPTSRPEED